MSNTVSCAGYRCSLMKVLRDLVDFILKYLEVIHENDQVEPEFNLLVVSVLKIVNLNSFLQTRQASI